MGHNCIVFLPSKAISGAEKPESPKHDALTRFAVRVRLRFNADGVGRDAFLHPAYYGMNTSSVMQRQYLAPSDGLDVCVEMDIVGVIEGANKSSVISYSVDFLRHYQKLFEEFRDLPINLIEIGIAGGISLRLWEWYFSAARIVGMDINPACESLATSRVHIEIGSQIDKDLLTSICKRYPPTIFIDDGSHFAEHNIVTFEHAFPLLNPGGIYVVEDMFFHFGPKPERWQSGTHRSSADYFLDLARSLMARKHVPGSEQVPRAITAMVDTVTFIGGAAIIRKKYAVRDIGSAIKIGEQTIARIQKPGAGYYRLAEYIFQHNGPPEEIERACLAAMEGGNNSVRVRSILATVLWRAGRHSEAKEVMVAASHLPAQKADVMQAFAEQQVSMGMISEARSTLQAILSRESHRLASKKLLASLTGGLDQSSSQEAAL